MVAIAGTSSEALTHRVTGPRKITLKNRLRSHVSAFADMIMQEQMNGQTNPLNIQRLEENGVVAEILTGTSDLIEIGDEFPLENQTSRVISADARVFVNEVTEGTDKIDVRGDVVLRILLSDESSGKTFLVTRKIPFDRDIEIEGVTPDSESRVIGRMSNISINMDEGKIISDLSSFLTPSSKEYSFTYTRDMYSTENQTTTTYRATTFPFMPAR